MMESSEDIASRLEKVLSEIRELSEVARRTEQYGVERTLEHVISHIQTILESMKLSEAGYNI